MSPTRSRDRQLLVGGRPGGAAWSLTPADVEALTGRTLDSFAHNCHVASLALVRVGVGQRVLRGSCPGIIGQHSWVLVSGTVYSPDAVIIDPTLWSYRDDVDGIFEGPAGVYPHVPHGAGSLFSAGPPPPPRTGILRLTPEAHAGLSPEARSFLDDVIGPLDARGWMVLSNAGMGDWPAGEILTAMAATPALAAFPPIDRLGMLTDANPGGLYLPDPDYRHRLHEVTQDPAMAADGYDGGWLVTCRCGQDIRVSRGRADRLTAFRAFGAHLRRERDADPLDGRRR